MTMVLDGSGLTTTGVPNSGTAQASTSGTAITFTGIPSGVKRITVMYKGISTSGTNALLVQIGSGSVSTSGYSSSSFGGAVGNVLSGNNSAIGFLNANSLVAANTYDGICVLVNITGNSWVASSNLTNTNTSSVGFIGTGSIALSGVLDRVSITTVGSTDTFDAGSVNIIYE